MFIGRKKELKELDRYLEFDDKGHLISIIGRRRVGKSKLIEEFIKRNTNKEKIISLYFTGNNSLSSDQNLSWCFKFLFRQLEDINIELIKLVEKNRRTWMSFFVSLDKIANHIKNNYPEKKLVITFDEISWYSKKNNFINNFATIWNQSFVKNENIVVIIAGSVASWIQEKIFENKSTLYNRLSYIIKLESFSIKEIKEYLRHKNQNISNEIIINYYLVFGGIIKYYEYIDLNKTFKENIVYFFNNHLESERTILYSSLFDVSEKRHYKDIISVLSQKKNATIREIITAIESKHDGKKIYEATIYKDIDDLILSGMIIKNSGLYKNYENSLYINDLFSYFVYYWENSKIEENFNTPRFNTWKGLAFEIFIFNQYKILLENKTNSELLLNVKTETRLKNKTKIINQIDVLLINKEKKLVSVVECKNHNNVFRIDIEELDDIYSKADNLKSFTDYQKNIIVFSLHGSQVTREAITNLGNQYPIENVSVIELLD